MCAHDYLSVCLSVRVYTHLNARLCASVRVNACECVCMWTPLGVNGLYGLCCTLRVNKHCCRDLLDRENKCVLHIFCIINSKHIGGPRNRDDCIRLLHSDVHCWSRQALHLSVSEHLFFTSHDPTSCIIYSRTISLVKMVQRHKNLPLNENDWPEKANFTIVRPKVLLLCCIYVIIIASFYLLTARKRIHNIGI